MTNTKQQQRITLLILPVVAFSFIAYLSIGMPLAILPSFAHLSLGASTVVAGLLVSLQYIATFITRPRAGKMSDTIGPRQTVRYGLIACALSGFLLFAAAFLKAQIPLCLITIALSRLCLGTGESMCATGATLWGIGRVGHENTARTISLNGVATYGALAVGAPLGVFVEAHFGFATIGALIWTICAIAFIFATMMEPTEITHGEQLPLRQIVARVTPYGMGLAVGGLGFGIIATFITLYFAHQHWEGAALSLTIFGTTFVGARLLFADFITRFGGYRVAIISFAIEAAGLFVLSSGHSPGLAYLGTALTGLGFSLIFPALGVEVVKTFQASVHGSVLGVYNAFVDLSLFLTGPVAGAVIDHYGYGVTFAGTACAVLVMLVCTYYLARSVKPVLKF